MPPRKPVSRSSSSRTTTKPSAPKQSAPKTSRPAPVRQVRAAVAPHVKTLANGQPRPKRRG